MVKCTPQFASPLLTQKAATQAVGSHVSLGGRIFACGECMKHDMQKESPHTWVTGRGDRRVVSAAEYRRACLVLEHRRARVTVQSGTQHESSVQKGGHATERRRAEDWEGAYASRMCIPSPTAGIMPCLPPHHLPQEVSAHTVGSGAASLAGPQSTVPDAVWMRPLKRPSAPATHDARGTGAVATTSLPDPEEVAEYTNAITTYIHIQGGKGSWSTPRYRSDLFYFLVFFCLG